MRIVCLLSFHDEDPALLSRCVSSLRLADVDVVVSLPGPYRHYPSGRADPSPEEVEAVRAAAEAADVLVVMPPAEVYEGDEVGKRQRLLDVASEITDEGDFYLVMDADYRILSAPEDLRARLEATDADAAVVSFVEHHDERGAPIRAGVLLQPILRARRDLRMGANHYTYSMGGAPSTIYFDPSSVVALDLSEEMEIEHCLHLRSRQKRERQAEFYRRRDALGLEQTP